MDERKNTKKVMEKVKIKRVARNKKKASTAEKVMAGIGLGTGLLGGGASVAPKANNQTQIVSSKIQNKNSTGLDVKKNLAKIFKTAYDNTIGVPQAKADEFDDAGQQGGCDPDMYFGGDYGGGGGGGGGYYEDSGSYGGYFNDSVEADTSGINSESGGGTVTNTITTDEGGNPVSTGSLDGSTAQTQVDNTVVNQNEVNSNEGSMADENPDGTYKNSNADGTLNTEANSNNGSSTATQVSTDANIVTKGTDGQLTDQNGNTYNQNSDGSLQANTATQINVTEKADPVPYDYSPNTATLNLNTANIIDPNTVINNSGSESVAGDAVANTEAADQSQASTVTSDTAANQPQVNNAVSNNSSPTGQNINNPVSPVEMPVAPLIQTQPEVLTQTTVVQDSNLGGNVNNPAAPTVTTPQNDNQNIPEDVIPQEDLNQFQNLQNTNAANIPAPSGSEAIGSYINQLQASGSTVVEDKNGSGNYTITDSLGNTVTVTKEGLDSMSSSQSQTPATSNLAASVTNVLNKPGQVVGSEVSSLTNTVKGLVTGNSGAVSGYYNDTYTGKTTNDASPQALAATLNDSENTQLYNYDSNDKTVSNVYYDDSNNVYVKNGSGYTLTGITYDQLDTAKAAAQNESTNLYGINGSELTAVGSDTYKDSQNNLYTLDTNGVPVMSGLSVSVDPATGKIVTDNAGLAQVTANPGVLAFQDVVNKAVDANLQALSGDSSKVGLSVSLGDDGLIHLSAKNADGSIWEESMSQNAFATQVVSVDKSGFSLSNIGKTITTAGMAISTGGTSAVLQGGMGAMQGTGTSVTIDPNQPLILYNKNTGSAVVIDPANSLDPTVAFVDSNGTTKYEVSQSAISSLLKGQSATDINGASVSPSDLSQWVGTISTNSSAATKTLGILKKVATSLDPMNFSNNPSQGVLAQWSNQVQGTTNPAPASNSTNSGGITGKVGGLFKKGK